MSRCKARPHTKEANRRPISCGGRGAINSSLVAVTVRTSMVSVATIPIRTLFKLRVDISFQVLCDIHPQIFKQSLLKRAGGVHTFASSPTRNLPQAVHIMGEGMTKSQSSRRRILASNSASEIRPERRIGSASSSKDSLYSLVPAESPCHIETLASAPTFLRPNCRNCLDSQRP